MVVTVFKNRLRPGVEKEYGAHVAKLLEIAQKMPGFVAIKGYAAEDGEHAQLEHPLLQLDLYGFGYDSDHGAGSYEMNSATLTATELTPATAAS